jgi:hypothetical protein
MGAIRRVFALAAAAAAPLAWAAVADGNDCGGYTAAEAAAWLKAPAAQVTRQVSKSGDKWVCTFAVGNAPAIAFSVAVASSARRASDDLERYRDKLAAEGETARWKGRLPNGVYSDMFGAGDEAVWSDIDGIYTVRRDNVTVQVTLPKGKERQAQLGKAVVEGF